MVHRCQCEGLLIRIYTQLKVYLVPFLCCTLSVHSSPKLGLRITLIKIPRIVQGKRWKKLGSTNTNYDNLKAFSFVIFSAIYFSFFLSFF